MSNLCKIILLILLNDLLFYYYFQLTLDNSLFCSTGCSNVFIDQWLQVARSKDFDFDYRSLCNLCHLSSKNSRDLLVPAAPMWGFASFLYFISPWIQYFWVLDCWLDKASYLETLPLSLSSCDGHFYDFRTFYRPKNELINLKWSQQINQQYI